MKKIGLLLMAVFALISFSACNDNDGDYASYAEFATVKILPGNDYYFEIDGQQTAKSLYPGDRTRIGGYSAEEGQRVIVYFNLLPEKKETYDFNGAIYGIGNIYTGTSTVIDTQEVLDAVKDDPLNLFAAQCSKNYLTIRANYPVHNNVNHSFVLIRNNVTEPGKTFEGYYNVELRHDADGELQGSLNMNYLSFDLATLQDELEGMKGLLIRVNALDSGSEQYYKADLPKQE